MQITIVAAWQVQQALSFLCWSHGFPEMFCIFLFAHTTSTTHKTNQDKQQRMQLNRASLDAHRKGVMEASSGSRIQWPVAKKPHYNFLGGISEPCLDWCCVLWHVCEAKKWKNISGWPQFWEIGNGCHASNSPCVTGENWWSIIFL